MLGAIVATLSGKSYYDYVREHIFTRSDMTTADFFTKAQWHDDRRIAHPYLKNDSGQWTDTIDTIRGGIGNPAAGAFASAADLSRFASAFQRNELLEPAYAYLVSCPKTPPLDQGSVFGSYAMLAFLANGRWFYGNNGGAPGVHCNLDWFPDSGWMAVVLANYDQAAVPIVKKARELIPR